MINSTNLEVRFQDAIAAAGLTPPTSIKADGELHRFSTNRQTNDKAGWYVLHSDPPAGGAFGCWRSGVTETWSEVKKDTLSKLDRERHIQRMAEVNALAQAERQRDQTNAAAEASRIWSQAQPAKTDHPYLSRKGVQSHGLRVDADGSLLVPMHLNNQLVSVQRIYADGKKRFLKNGIKKGASFTIPGIAGPMIVVEGYTTAASVVEATGLTVHVGAPTLPRMHQEALPNCTAKLSNNVGPPQLTR